MHAAGPSKCWYPHTKQITWPHMPDNRQCNSLSLYFTSPQEPHEIMAGDYTVTFFHEDVDVGK